MAVDPKHDAELKARDASHLFESSTTYVSLRANSYLRRYLYDFIRLFAPELTPEVVGGAVQAGRTRHPDELA